MMLTAPEGSGYDLKLAANYDELFDYAHSRGFGNIHIHFDQATGLQAIVAIHNTKLGPALGGCRILKYASSIAAILDAMRLARGMSYKSALVNVPHGGGKAVILEPNNISDRAAYFQEFGRFVHQLNGRYITAVDVGTTLEDMDNIHKSTPYVASLSAHTEGPSSYTALGVYSGIEAAVQYKLGKDSLQDVHIAIQGLGKVGYALAKRLHQAGARLTVADINTEATQRCADELCAKVVNTDAIMQQACDVLAPCAMGAVLSPETIPGIQAPIIAGAANNQLASQKDGQRLHQLGILYAPDYVINSGGLIYAAGLYNGLPDEKIEKSIDHIAKTLHEVFEKAEKTKQATSVVADNLAQEKLA